MQLKLNLLSKKAIKNLPNFWRIQLWRSAQPSAVIGRRRLKFSWERRQSAEQNSHRSVSLTLHFRSIFELVVHLITCPTLASDCWRSVGGGEMGKAEELVGSKDHAMMSEKERLKSYRNWPFNAGSLAKEKMATAGFYHCGTLAEPDAVRCFSCLIGKVT